MITINGYSLNSQFTSLAELAETLLKRPVIAKSKNDGKALLRVLQYMGVKHMVYDVSRVLELNIPQKAKADHVYQLIDCDGEIVVNMVRRDLYLTHEHKYFPVSVSKIIVGKSALQSLKDWTCDL